MSAENPADTVIEQAARRLAWAMADADGIHPGDFETDPFDDLTDDAQREVLAFARALHAAGLLADPADRDERFAEAVAKVTPCTCSAQRSRAQRAEAELSNMEADYDRRGERLWRLAAKAGHEPHESDNDATAELAIHAELDRLRAQVAAVRALADEWDRTLQDTLLVEINELRAALDGEGEQ